jgi:hypothetical protein
MRVPINITGQTAKSRSRPLTSQLTQNFYAELSDDPGAKYPYVLMPFPGAKAFGSASGLDRGMHVHKGTLYKVTGTTLYSVDTSGAHTSLGSIPGTGRCIFAGMLSNLVLTTGGKAYQYNGSTVAEITDPQLESPASCAHLNNQMLYDGDNSRFCSSDVGDATAIDGLNYASAESEADDLLRVFTHNQYAYLLGETTIETWWNSGVGSPPFDRIEQGIMQVGLGALHSVASNDDAWYLLGDDNHVYRIIGLERSQVTTIAIHHALSTETTVIDAIGLCFDIEGQRFYLLSLPTANKSWLFSEQTGWTTLSSSGGRSLANSYAYYNRKHLVADYRGGAIYEWDLDTFAEVDDPIERIRETGPIHGGLLGAPGLTVEMDSFELIMETGQGLLTGQGSDPKIALQVSDDGGKTWGTEMWESIGKSGEFREKVSWHALGSFYERILRIKISDPVFCSIHSATAELSAGI